MTDKKIDRREFILTSAKAVGAATALGSGLFILSSCAYMYILSLEQEGPVTYPRLAGQKIQSPEHYGLGQKCMVGLWLGQIYEFSLVEPMIEYYINKIGKPISFFFLPYKGRVESQICTGNNSKFLKAMYDIGAMGIIPFVTFDASEGFQLGGRLEQLIAGRCDSYIRKSAIEYKEYGEKHGGFFIRMFQQEMNAQSNWDFTAKPSSTKKAWIHIWNIFDSEGANEYATWVFNPYSSPHFVGSWQAYYPGDKYVDWLGFNGFAAPLESILGYYKDASFVDQFAENLSVARQNHPLKPVMVAQVGSTMNYRKGRWQRKAFANVKKMQAIKGIGWRSEKWTPLIKQWRSVLDNRYADTRIDTYPEALEGFKSGISDSYFLGKVPCQKK